MAKTYELTRIIYPFKSEGYDGIEFEEGIAYELHVGEGNLASLRPEDNPNWFKEIKKEQDARTSEPKACKIQKNLDEIDERDGAMIEMVKRLKKR